MYFETGNVGGDVTLYHCTHEQFFKRSDVPKKDYGQSQTDVFVGFPEK
jgi:hypothetical protein